MPTYVGRTKPKNAAEEATWQARRTLQLSLVSKLTENSHQCACGILGPLVKGTGLCINCALDGEMRKRDVQQGLGASQYSGMTAACKGCGTPHWGQVACDRCEHCPVGVRAASDTFRSAERVPINEVFGKLGAPPPECKPYYPEGSWHPQAVLNESRALSDLRDQLDFAKKGRESATRRSEQLADELTELLDENRNILAENGKLRRQVEDLSRKAKAGAKR